MKPNQFVTTNKYAMRLCGIAAGVSCLVFVSTVAPAATEVAPAMKAQVQSSYGKLPLSFEANQGQTDAQVKFLSRGHGFALFLTPTEAVLSLKKPQAQAKTPLSSVKSSLSPSVPEAVGAVLRMQLVGANPAPQVLGKEALPGMVNYLIGKDPGKWHTGVPTYGKVAYEGVYPGVDLVYYGDQGQLEYDFVVAPGADPGKVKLAFQGANKIEVNPAGELVLHAASGDIQMHKPVLYQEIGGVRKPVDGEYVLKDGQAVGFQVAAYDATRSLVIDPVLVYSTYLGGSTEDFGSGIAVDKWGQAFVTGDTISSDFPTKNALQPAFGGGLYDAFVAKLSADGRALRYSTYLGGSGNDAGLGIAVDQRGQAYVTGDTISSDFPTKNALQPAFGGGLFDAFVAKLTADGAALRYATYLGGSSGEGGAGIAVDQWGQAFVTGTTDSTNFPTRNALQPTFGGFIDAFVAKLSADGRALRYATYLGGSALEQSHGIALDKHGQAYVTGRTVSVDFPTKNALQPAFGGFNDAFVAKLTADGRALRYATYLGGNEIDDGNGIAVDERGQAYVTGATFSTDFPTKNALQPVFAGQGDAFVAKLTADGGAFRYSTYLGGSGAAAGFGIAVDERGHAYVTGFTDSTNFPTKDALQPTFGGNGDAFVTKIGSDERHCEHGKKCEDDHEDHEDHGKDGHGKHDSKN